MHVKLATKLDRLATLALQYFTNIDWEWLNNKCIHLQFNLPGKSRENIYSFSLFFQKAVKEVITGMCGILF